MEPISVKRAPGRLGGGLGFRLGIVPLLLALTVALAGCGEDAGEEETGPVETVDPPAKLPRGWSGITNVDGGFTFGLPPGWRARKNGARTIVTAPKGAVALTIAADRTDEALSLPAGEYATEIAEGLREQGFERLRIEDPVALRAPYAGSGVAATGVRAESEVRQRLEAIVLKRPGIAAFTILVARNARTPPDLYAKQLGRLVRSLRSRPPEPES